MGLSVGSGAGSGAGSRVGLRVGFGTGSDMGLRVRGLECGYRFGERAHARERWRLIARARA